MLDLPSGLLDRPRTRLAEEIAHVLRSLIMHGELKPGTPLLQLQLAERLGVSRTPLREAFLILERDGLLRTANGNKTVEVVTLDRRRLIETYQIREMIDGLAARLAAEHCLPEPLERVGHALARMLAASRSALDPAEYAEGHASFHLSIVDASGNARLSDFKPLVRLSTHMLQTRYLQQNVSGPELDTLLPRTIHDSNCDHQEILTTISSGDGKAAEEAARHHIRRTLTLLENTGTDDQS